VGAPAFGYRVREGRDAARTACTDRAFPFSEIVLVEQTAYLRRAAAHSSARVRCKPFLENGLVPFASEKRRNDRGNISPQHVPRVYTGIERL
jgi:hypothetical protein